MKCRLGENKPSKNFPLVHISGKNDTKIICNFSKTYDNFRPKAICEKSLSLRPVIEV